MTNKDYSFISERVYEACGIVLSEQKKDMVYARISRRIRAIGLSSFAEYITYLSENESVEFGEFINAITTNLTSFFREKHHFSFLKETALPEIITRHQHDQRVRIWSAGCSLGMEPYSIAICLDKLIPSNWDFKILATDLDTNVLASGREAVYSGNQVSGLSDKELKKYFLKDGGSARYKAKEHIKKNISFKQLNLLKEWPMKGPFDVIFCRNVIIYFDHETKVKLFNRYAKLLAPGGYLILGHSESMGRENLQFKGLGQNVYQKIVQ
ncbi:protein-glutamate O-methyltransferase CheR [Psychrosphaera sp.]|nr:protein-glutamate O-methyltransferase CheR [Psychrosphaera sp.]